MTPLPIRRYLAYSISFTSIHCTSLQKRNRRFCLLGLVKSEINAETEIGGVAAVAARERSCGTDELDFISKQIQNNSLLPKREWMELHIRSHARSFGREILEMIYIGQSWTPLRKDS